MPGEGGLRLCSKDKKENHEPLKRAAQPHGAYFESVFKDSVWIFSVEGITFMNDMEKYALSGILALKFCSSAGLEVT